MSTADTATQTESSKGPAYRLYRGLRRLARNTLDSLHDRPEAVFRWLLKRAKRQGSLHLVFDHRMGGGSNIYRDRWISERIASPGSSVLLVTIGRDDREIVCTLHRQRRLRHRPASVAALMDLLRTCEFDEIVINDLVTWPDPIGVMASISDVRREKQIPLTIFFHDHFFLCPSWSLLNHEERYCGLPEDLQACNRCLKQHGDRFVRESEVSDMPQWRQACAAFLGQAREVICFSHYTTDLIRKAFPGLTLNIVVRPHALLHTPTQLPRPDHAKPLRIGVLGNIGFHKGARIVEEVAALIEREQLDAQIVIIGRYSRPATKGIHVHGGYERSELGTLIDRYGINMFFFPSIWPETFSYVCAEIMALQMPLVAFDLGAPAERTRDYARGRLVRTIDAASALASLKELHESLSALTVRELRVASNDRLD